MTVTYILHIKSGKQQVYREYNTPQINFWYRNCKIKLMKKKSI